MGFVKQAPCRIGLNQQGRIRGGAGGVAAPPVTLKSQNSGMRMPKFSDSKINLGHFSGIFLQNLLEMYNNSVKFVVYGYF